MSHEVATSAAVPFAASSRVANATGLGPLRHVEVTGSTNADLVAEAREGFCGPAVLVADHQSAGRGRLGREWDDDRGDALLVSIRVPAELDGVGGVVAAVGAAARFAADQLTTSTVLTKWPNDLVVEDGAAPGKLGGVLAEYVAEAHESVPNECVANESVPNECVPNESVPNESVPNESVPNECVIVGVGINVRAIERQPGATSMAECGMEQSGSLADRDLLLSGLLSALAPRLADPVAVLEEMRANSATLGARVRVELPGNRFVTGEAVGLSDEGHLLLRCDDATHRTITAGDVIRLRPAT